jgi:hypothetical protein
MATPVPENLIPEEFRRKREEIPVPLELLPQDFRAPVAATEAAPTEGVVPRDMLPTNVAAQRPTTFWEYLKTFPFEDPSKLFSATSIEGTAGAPLGAEEAARALPRKIVTGEAVEDTPLYRVGQALLGKIPTKEEQKEKLQNRAKVDKFIDENVPRIPGLKELAEGGKEVAKSIRESVSEEGQQAIRDSQISGNILEAATTGDFSKLSFGDNPSLYGYALQGVDTLGSLFPVIISGALGAKAAGTVGGGMAASDGANTARDYIQGKTDVELLAASPYYRAMREGGMPEDQARRIISDRAAEQAALLQGAVGLFGGVATQKIIGGTADKIIGAAGRNRLMMIAAGGALGGLEEGTQEFLEGIAADLGINKEVIKEVGENSFANLILGFLGGAPVGAARGAIAPKPPKGGSPVPEDMLPEALRAPRIEPTIGAAPPAEAAPTIAPFSATGPIAPEAVEVQEPSADTEQRDAMRYRLDQLERKSKGVPEQKVKVGGQEFTIPAVEPEFFTPDEKKEYDSLREQLSVAEPSTTEEVEAPIAPPETTPVSVLDETAPEIIDGRPVSQEPLPLTPEEEAELDYKTEFEKENNKRVEELEKRYKTLISRAGKGESLRQALSKQLSDSDIADLGSEKYFKDTFGAPKNRPAKRLEDFIGDGLLNDWLPENLHINSDLDSPDVVMDKSIEGLEYIKERLRNRNFLTEQALMEARDIDNELRAIREFIEREAGFENLRDILTDIYEEEIGRGFAESESSDTTPDIGAPAPAAPAVAAPAIEPQELKISPEEQIRLDLANFEAALRVVTDPFRSVALNGRKSVLRPRPLSNAQVKLIMKLAQDAIDLGMPSSSLSVIKSSGATGVDAGALIASRTGALMLGKQWASSTEAEKLATLVHEIGHTVDFDSSKNEVGLISTTTQWEKAHGELKAWYDKFPATVHPMSYPFSKFFDKRIPDKRLESFPQAFAYYFTDPVALQNNAPSAYSEIQSIVERIQNGSQATAGAGAQATGVAPSQIRQKGIGEDTKIQPAVSEERSGVGRTEQLEDRAAAVARPDIKLRRDNPGGEWLQNKKEDSLDAGLNQFRVPRRFGSVTGTLNRNVLVSVDKLARVKGMRGEQMAENIRPKSLDYLTKQMSETGRLPESSVKGEDYVPFLNIYQDGTPYVNEGNHRIMVAKQLGWKYIPIQISWFNGAEQAGGLFSPETLMADDARAYEEGYSLENYSEPVQVATSMSPEDKRRADMERDLFRLTPEGQVAPQTGVQGDMFGAQGVQAVPEALKKKLENERQLQLLLGDKDPDALFDLAESAIGSEAIPAEMRTPAFTVQFDKWMRRYNDGQISAERFAELVAEAREEQLSAKQKKPLQPRTRGADFIRQKLLEARRRGDISFEAVDLTEWFITNNPQLVEDLGISLRTPTDGGVSAAYDSMRRIAIIMKGSNKIDAAVHEILHHLERMMPADIRAAIQKSWMKEYLKAKKQTSNNKDAQKFFELLDSFHFGDGGKKAFEAAIDLIKDGRLSYRFYQLANPSEFWAVNASRIVKGQFDVRGSLLGRLRLWLTKLGATLKDLFGMSSDAPIIKALDSLAKSDGKFISADMLQSNANYFNVRRNIFGLPVSNRSWDRPDDSKTDNFLFKMQDKMIDTKRVVENIRETVRNLDDRWDAYLKEELYHGRAATKTKRFLQDELEPIMKDMARRGLSMIEVEEYLHNRHAEERNIVNARRDPSMPDGGSGILTQDARDYLAKLPAAKKADLEAVAKKFDAITKGTRQLLVDSGHESPDTISVWESTYQHYVPLKREESDYELGNMSSGVGQGFGVKGAFSRQSVGSDRPVVDIIANIAEQRENAIVRTEKMRVAQALYGLVVQNPNPGFWMAVDPDGQKNPQETIDALIALGVDPMNALNVVREPYTRTVDKKTNKVILSTPQWIRKSDMVLPVRINGKDKFIFFNPRDPRAKRMVEALKNIGADNLQNMLGTVSEVTRYFAAINTQYNPIFGVINFIRDVQGATLQLSTTELAGEQKAILAEAVPALRGIYADLRARRKGQPVPQGSFAQLWEEFQAEGGQTGFRDQFSKSQERADALQRVLDPSSWAESKLGRIFTANGTLKVPLEVARKSVAAPIFDWLSDYNETMENAIRLAAYKVAKEKGMTSERAASLAKNLTVNFNRKGDVARQVGALYAFFNASVQGTMRMYQTLKGPAGKTILGGGLVLGVVQALGLMAAGFDEDEPPDFIKERNIVIPVGDGKYITIPMPLGYNVIPNTSRVLTEWALAGGRDPGKRVTQIFGAFLEMFNPIGNAGFSYQTFAPTVSDPVVALLENKDWTGKPIAKEDMNKLDPTPGYTRARESASALSTKLSEFINYLTFGSKDTKGFLSPTPDQIDYLVGQLTGGVGREILKAEKTVRSSITGEDLPLYNIPLVGRFVGDTKGSAATRNKFYENVTKLNVHNNVIEGRRERKEDISEYLKDNPDARLYKMSNSIQQDVQDLNKRRKYLLTKDAPKEEIVKVEQMIAARMKILNDAVKRTEK